MRFVILFGIALLVAVPAYLLYEFVLYEFVLGGSGGPEREGPAPPAHFDRSDPREAGVQPIALTHDAWELRRIRGEHEGLIASIPATPGPAPTRTVEEIRDAALARVLSHPDGVPLSRPVDEGWFDPKKGLAFFREPGGDWTPRRVRENHPYRSLFYHDGYPEGIANFADGSIHRGLARELAFAGVEVMPMLEEPSPGMVNALTMSLGWELRDSPGPAVNVWSSFSLLDGSNVHSFAVGGVMRMGVRSRGEGEDMFQYLAPGEWVGSVVVERLG